MSANVIIKENMVVVNWIKQSQQSFLFKKLFVLVTVIIWRVPVF